MPHASLYRVGIIGFGFIGKVHAYAYRTLPFYYDPLPLDTAITHVVTAHPETASRARKMLGADVGTTDFREVTENPDIDIVHVCTPNHLHAAALQSALDHHKHIYCDKPLVASWAEACALHRSVTGNQQTTQMTFQNRYFPAITQARKLIAADRVGEILGFRAVYLHGGSAHANAPLKWKLTRAAGGGVIADLASHVLDLIEYLAGPIQRVQAATHIAYRERPSVADPSKRVPVDAEDAVLALVELASGAIGSLEATKIATGTEDELRLEIHGSRGALRFHLMDAHHLEYYDATSSEIGGWQRLATGQRFAPPATTFPSPKASIGWLRAHVACLANFLHAVARGTDTDPNLRHGIRIQRLIEALHQSVARGHWIDVASIELGNG